MILYDPSIVTLPIHPLKFQPPSQGLIHMRAYECRCMQFIAVHILIHAMDICEYLRASIIQIHIYKNLVSLHLISIRKQTYLCIQL